MEVPMTNALSSMFKEAEIERLMADTLMERLTAEDAPGKAAASSKRIRAIVRKAVRDVFDGVAQSGKPDPAAVRLLEPICAVVARKRAELSERNMELLVEAMLPANDPMSAVRSKIEVDNARVRARFAQEVACFTSAELADLAGHGARNRSATGSRWKAERKAFSVQLGGRELFPAFQFRDGKPDPAVAQVLDALPTGMSQWQVAFWFVSSNPWLDGGVPSENLAKVDSVVEAARRLGEEAAG
jgi:hypothetical protein